MAYSVTRRGPGAFVVGPAKRPGMAAYGVTSARPVIAKRGGAMASWARRPVTGAGGLGVFPVAVAAEALTSIIHVSSDPTNLADNAVLYQRALAGNTQALVNLATVSGQAGQNAGIPNAGMISITSTPIWRSGIGQTLLGGWGGAASQADAAAKYQAASAALGGGTPVGLVQPVVGSGGPQSYSPSTVVPQIITAYNAQGQPLQAASILGSVSPTVLVIGGFALLGMILTRPRRVE